VKNLNLKSLNLNLSTSTASHNNLPYPGAGSPPAPGAFICGKCAGKNILRDYDSVNRKPDLKCMNCGSRKIRAIQSTIQLFNQSTNNELETYQVKKQAKHSKHIFTSEVDEQIRKVYREDLTGKGQVNTLADQLGLPRWRISHRAREIGAYEPRIKEPCWSNAELEILKIYAYLTPERIRILLKKAGFTRSITGVLLKRKRLELLKCLGGYSANQLCKLFGIDSHCVMRWIENGDLKAIRRGTARTEQQGGDGWFITKEDVKTFIVQNIGIIDIRKVDKFWFVEMLTGPSASEQ
jgi:DNA-directed RNA polymerase subunit RPC12/RpoP